MSLSAQLAEQAECSHRCSHEAVTTERLSELLGGRPLLLDGYMAVNVRYPGFLEAQTDL